MLQLHSGCDPWKWCKWTGLRWAPQVEKGHEVSNLSQAFGSHGLYRFPKTCSSSIYAIWNCSFLKDFLHSPNLTKFWIPGVYIFFRLRYQYNHAYISHRKDAMHVVQPKMMASAAGGSTSSRVQQLWVLHLLVSGLQHCLFFHMLGIISPIDELIFFRGVGQPPISQRVYP